MKKVVFLLCLTSLAGCPLDMWQTKMIMAKYERESKAYYNKETPEQKALREENDLFCTQLAELPENRAKGGLKMDMIFDDCMKECGSPLF